MNPAVRTTYDFIKNKEFRCEVENYSTPWESARSCANSDLGTMTFEDNDDCFHSKPHVSTKKLMVKIKLVVGVLKPYLCHFVSRMEVVVQ